MALLPKNNRVLFLESLCACILYIKYTYINLSQRTLLLVQTSALSQRKISEKTKKGTKAKSGVFLFPCLGQTFEKKVLVAADLPGLCGMEDNAASSYRCR